MFKYIAKQIKPGTEDFGYVFEDEQLMMYSGDINDALFIFQNNDCQFNDDIYSDYLSQLEDLADAFDYYRDDHDSWVDYASEPGHRFETDDDTIELLCYCAKCAYEQKYPEALAVYLIIETGNPWNAVRVYGNRGNNYCTLVYSEDYYSTDSLNYYGKMWLGCGGEFALGELEVPDDEDYTVDLSDLGSFEHLVTNWVPGCFIIDDIIQQGGNRLVSEIADCFDVSEKYLEIYVYENGNYVNILEK